MPVEVKVRLYTQSRYDEEQEEWSIHPAHMAESTISAAGSAHTRRPVSVAGRRRPISEYAQKQIKASDAAGAGRVPTNGHAQATSTPVSPLSPTGSATTTTTSTADAVFAAAVRFKGENILNYELDYPMRTTNDYQNPKVSASLQAVLAEAMQTNDEMDINGQQVRCGVVVLIRNHKLYSPIDFQSSYRSRLDKIMKRDSGVVGATSNSGINGGAMMMMASR